MHKPNIFLAHNYRDHDFARQIAKDLSRHGANVWLDEAIMFLGDSLVDKACSTTDETIYIAVILSRKSVNSSWIKKDARAIMDNEGGGQLATVLPLFLEDCVLPEFLQDLLIADFRKPERYEEALDLIIRRLGLPDHPSPMLKAGGLQWPPPDEAFQETRLLQLKVVLYDGQEFCFGNDRFSGVITTTDTIRFAELHFSSAYVSDAAEPFEMRPAHYESKSWILRPQRMLKDLGINSGDHIVCAVGSGMYVEISALIKELTHALKNRAEL